jgi:hypothetical protein
MLDLITDYKFYRLYYTLMQRVLITVVCLIAASLQEEVNIHSSQYDAVFPLKH